MQPVSSAADPGVTPRPTRSTAAPSGSSRCRASGSRDPLPADFTGACDPQPQYAMFVNEVELERLNLARTSDAVIAGSSPTSRLKLRFADDIALESTGRITYDGMPIDASPENAAMYQSLMKTGTIPGLPATMAGPPALVGPAPRTTRRTASSTPGSSPR